MFRLGPNLRGAKTACFGLEKEIGGQLREGGQLPRGRGDLLAIHLAEAVELNLAWIRAGSCNQHLGAEGESQLLHPLVVDVPLLVRAGGRFVV